MSLESIDYNDSEIALGLVGPVGVDLDIIEETLKDLLSKFNYKTNVIRLSKFIEGLLELYKIDSKIIKKPYYDQIQSLMKGGSDLRDKTKRGDLIALAAVFSIPFLLRSRINPGSHKLKPLGRIAHIFRGLKHPDEEKVLRRIYGPGFFLISIYADERSRFKFLNEIKNMGKHDAERLMERDQDEGLKLGQRTRDTFQLADVFIKQSTKKDIKVQIERFINLVFGKPDITPTKDEHAMFLAFASSLRSACLSRQVGAAITESHGDLISLGANDVPCFGGGLYWPGKGDMRDTEKGFDTNNDERNKIIDNIMDKLKEEIQEIKVLPSSSHKNIRDTLCRSKLHDITEYGRTVHSEMEALMNCARVGVSPVKGSLYTTLYPCHNCARHIVAAGIRRVVYIEPYPKSHALQLHSDSISAKGEGGKVSFEPFIGIGPRRYLELFSMHLSPGYPLIRKLDETGKKVDWSPSKARLRVAMLPTTYMQREEIASKELLSIAMQHSPKKGASSGKSKNGKNQ